MLSPGLEIFYNTQKDLSKPPNYVSKHRRFNNIYSLTRNGQFEFSEDENYLAMAFPHAGKSFLYDLSDPDNIKKIPLLKCPTYRNLDKIFEFVYYTDARGIKRAKYLAITDYSSSKFCNMIKVYQIRTGVFTNGGRFSANLSPLRIRCHLDYKGRIDYVTSALILMVKDKDKKLNLPLVQDKVWSCTTWLLSSQEFPFYNIYRANLIRYLRSSSSAVEQQFYLEQLINTYKVMNEEQIVSNLKVSYTIFIFDLPGLFESIFTGRIDINMLFAVHKMLYLSFAKEITLRQNSLNSLANMFDESVKNKKYPKIDEECIYTVIADQNENLNKSPGCRSIMSHIIFSDCHINITSLVKDKYKSGFVLNDAEAAQTKLSRSLVQKKCTDIFVKRPKKTNDYRVYRSLVKLGLTNGSESSLGLFHSIQLMPDDEIRYKYRQLINFKWKLVYPISLVYTLTYFALNVLAYIYFGFNTYYPVGLAIMILNVLFVLYDFKCFGSQWKTFLKDANNIVDLAVHAVSFIAVFFIISDLIPSSHKYLKLIALAAVSLKGITLLKMFGALRMFIFLIGQIIVDLMWVPLILALVLILAGTIYKVAPLPGGNVNSGLTFFQAIEEVFYLIFMPTHADKSNLSNTADPSSILRSIIVVIGGTMIAQGIFNFIIAIFLQTFKRVNDDKEMFEIRALILDIRFIDLFLRGFDRFFKTQEFYYVFLVPDPKDGVLYENETASRSSF